MNFFYLSTPIKESPCRDSRVYICLMGNGSNKPKYYFLFWAFSAAFVIRAMILSDRAETYSIEGVSVWQSPLLFFVLSGLSFIIGLFLLQISKPEKE